MGTIRHSHRRDAAGNGPSQTLLWRAIFDDITNVFMSLARYCCHKIMYSIRQHVIPLITSQFITKSRYHWGMVSVMQVSLAICTK